MSNEANEVRNSEGRREFTPTSAMLRFFMDNGAEYTMYAMREGKMLSNEGHFKFLCDKLHQHEDVEVRVGFAQSLMFLGFRKFLEIVGKSMSQMEQAMPGLLKLKEKVSKLSLEEIDKMGPDELKDLLGKDAL